MRSVEPGPVDGRCAAPPSKSAFQRAVATSLLAPGTSTLRGPAAGDDGEAALRVATALGARVSRTPGAVEITGGGPPAGDTLDCGEAGLGLRMFSALAALYDGERTLVARGSLARRPMGMVVEPLRQLGARCETTDGTAPLRIRGPLRGGRVEVDGRVSSQFLTGLLIALPTLADDSLVVAEGLVSKPYVRLTLEVQRRWGVVVEPDTAFEHFAVAGGQSYAPTTWDVEGDWSGVSFLLVAGALAGSVAVDGVDADSAQADRRILEALARCGAEVDSGDDHVTVRRGELRAFSFDATHCPDLFPPLVALAAHCRGTTVLTGVQRLRHKESDRAAVLQREFGRLGGRVTLDGDRMQIEGGALAGGDADAHGDHRIAMAAAVTALGAQGPVSISGAACVAKSYPAFFEDLRALGAEVSR